MNSQISIYINAIYAIRMDYTTQCKISEDLIHIAVHNCKYVNVNKPINDHYIKAIQRPRPICYII